MKAFTASASIRRAAANRTTKRIVYHAAPGEKVEIKGSEIVKNWVKVQGDVWKATVPNSASSASSIPTATSSTATGSTPQGRQHHTGAVYLNGDWLIEAAKLDDVLKPAGNAPAWFASHDAVSEYLLNVAWFGPGNGSRRDSRIRLIFAAQHGTQTAACSEGGKCIGWIETRRLGSNTSGVDFGERRGEVEIRAASATDGGDHRNSPEQVPGRRTSGQHAPFRTPAIGRSGRRSRRRSSRPAA